MGDGFIRNKSRDSEYQKDARYYDRPPQVSVTESILQTRAVYSEMNDQQFAKWYSKRYGPKPEDVLAVLKRGDKA